jgi:propanol-preferring alcohol dehydrogenase
MTAFRLVGWGAPPEFREVPVPSPQAGEVLVAMAAVGLCRTDLGLIAGSAGVWPDPPYTLGHENAGRVVGVGAGVTSVREGDGVLVTALQFCGTCDRCLRGRHSECRTAGKASPGLGTDGGLAPYMVSPERFLVPLGDLDPVGVAPLGDAAPTAYRAVAKALPLLVPGSRAVVIGIGALGSFAVQFLRLLSQTSVVAIDTDPRKLAGARELGASTTSIMGVGTTDEIRALAPHGVDVVLDFVGHDDTLALAAAVIGNGGLIVHAGIGGGRLSVGWESLPMNARYAVTAAWDMGDFPEILALVRSGALEIRSTEYSFDRAGDALRDLEAGTVDGRAVVVLDGAR